MRYPSDSRARPSRRPRRSRLISLDIQPLCVCDMQFRHTDVTCHFLNVVLLSQDFHTDYDKWVRTGYTSQNVSVSRIFHVGIRLFGLKVSFVCALSVVTPGVYAFCIQFIITIEVYKYLWNNFKRL